MSPLDGWANFYVVVGSSAGALIGLQFVVVTLIANTPVVRDAALASGAFSTPSVVHFCVALLLSALLTAPWQGIRTVSVLWCLAGLSGLLYEVFVTLRMQKQTAYRPVFEDWVFHSLLPLGAYLTLTITAFTAYSNSRQSLFFVAGAVLLLLFVGIHNAWDGITYHVFVYRRRQIEQKDDDDERRD